jgi:arylsulfatase A-like enzyme
LPARLKLVLRTGLSLIPTVLSAAIVVGLAEGVVLLVRLAFASRLSFVGPNILWLAPLGYTVVFMAVLAGCLLPALVWKRAPVGRLTLFAIGSLGTVGILYTVSWQQLHIVAVVVLAIGVGYQLSRMEPRLTKILRPLRVAALAGLVLVIAVSLRLVSGLEGKGDSPSPAPNRPNIVLVVWDTVRDLNLSLYGHQRPTTPFLQRWATGGAVFERAFSTSSWTLPAHASLFTGRFPHELSVDWEAPLDGKFPTLAEVLRTHGYRTAGFVANVYYAARQSGLARGFDVWQDYRVSPTEILLSTGVVQRLLTGRARGTRWRHDLKRASEVTSAFERWLSRKGNQRPFFAFLNYIDAHDSYFAPADFVRRFADSGKKEERYDAAIAYLDAELARLLVALEARGLSDNTIVAVTSDHGEHFGDHRLRYHGNSLYRQAIQVPLVVVASGRIPAGLRVPVPVSLRNLPATLLDLAGILGQPLPGESHRRFWSDSVRRTQDEPVLAELTPAPGGPRNHRNAGGEIRSLVEGPFHYILAPNGSAELFDLGSDPLEADSLENPESFPVLAEMGKLLHQYDSLFPRKMGRPRKTR